jgi:hypothetical protein
MKKVPLKAFRKKSTSFLQKGLMISRKSRLSKLSFSELVKKLAEIESNQPKL